MEIPHLKTQLLPNPSPERAQSLDMGNARGDNHYTWATPVAIIIIHAQRPWRRQFTAKLIFCFKHRLGRCIKFASFSATAATTMTCQIVFNLYPFAESGYLPSANIVQIDRDGTLSHVLKKAIPTTIASYNMVLTPVQERLLGIIDLLQVKNIEAKFKTPKAKTATPLAKLWTEAATKAPVETYIHRQLDAFLSEILRDRLPITLDVEKRTLAKDVLLVFPVAEMVPHLAFHKTPAGIEYRLQLGNETQKWPIHEREVVPLTNTDPAWLLVDYALCRVVGINGNMVKPFRQKPMVQIPPDKEKVYFRQFIAKSIRRSRVEAEGFSVQQTDTLRTTRLEPIENVLEKCWLLKPVFAYDGTEFPAGDRRDRITTLDIPGENQPGEVTVHLVCRNPMLENERLQTLNDLGLQEENRLYKVPGNDGLDDCVTWLAQHRAALTAAGFTVVAPQVDGRILALQPHHIAVRSQAAGDWFDVQGDVQVGDFKFPFHAFIGHLRRGDRFFRLPDETFFLIPAAWFARYADLAGALQEDGDLLRLPKALYTVLQAINPTETADDFPDIDPDSIDYEPGTDLKAELRPYQLRGVRWLLGHYQQGFGTCLADDMGLGKTLQTIALLLHVKNNPAETTATTPTLSVNQLDLFQTYRAELRPLNALIILPASLVFNWQQELTRFAPSLFVCAHVGPKRGKDARALAGFDVLLTTYHTARQDLNLLEKIDWQFIILDESQQIKNRDSEVSKVVRGLHGRHKISLSGTPIENSLADLWTQMEFINPATLGTFREFRAQFLIPIEKQNDERAKARLFSRVRPFFLRRTKEEVAPDLPELTEQVFYSEMAADQRKRYESVKSATRNEILALFDDPKTRFAAIQALMRLRQIANHPALADGAYGGASGKFDDVLAQWDTIRRAGHKVLFFSTFEKHLQLFKTVFDAEKQSYAWLTGDTPMPERAREVARFQEDPTVQAFFITLTAGGVGLNLTAADYVFLLDPWWNPAREDQAIARAHRIGQQRPVTALRFIAHDSIEEKIRVLQESKRALGKDLFAAGGEMPELTRSDLELLLG